MKRSASFTHGFAVDDGISKLIVSVAVSRSNTAKQVALMGPGNIRVNSYTTLSMSMIFEVSSPKAGLYQLIFPNTVGKYKYNVQAVSKEAIEFDVNFMYQVSVRKNSPPISMTNPFKGEAIFSQ